MKLTSSFQTRLIGAKGSETEVFAVEKTRTSLRGTFADNLSLPVHRWFRYSAGYSAVWAEQVIRAQSNISNAKVLDPFAGSGTTLLAADAVGVPSVGFEAQPFVLRICQAKLEWNASPESFLSRAKTILEEAKATNPASQPNRLVEKCFTQQNTRELFALRDCVKKTGDDLLWLCLVSIIRRVSHVGTAPWQYVLPNRRKAKWDPSPFNAFLSQAQLMVNDMKYVQTKWPIRQSKVELRDARQASDSGERDFTFVLTSPPYANNFDYADAMRLELSVLGEVNDWGDLKRFRTSLIPSCTQHISSERVTLTELLADSRLDPIRNEIQTVCSTLEKVKESKGGKKQYDKMVAAYFGGMAKHWEELAQLLRPGTELCYVLGDSAPYGVYVPTDVWLAKLAEPYGLRQVRFEKVRDRNIKWKNRKHRVPLKEGNLWLRAMEPKKTK